MTKRNQPSRHKNNRKNFAKYKTNAKSNASTNPQRKPPSVAANPKQDHFRSRATINRLNLYNQKPDLKKMHERPKGSSRIEPDRKWFGNVRTIDQKALQKYRVQMAQQIQQPRSVLVRAKKLPMNLLKDPTSSQFRLLQVQTYEQTFGPNSQRKKAKIQNKNFQELASKCEKMEFQQKASQDEFKDQNRDIKMKAGQSRRIWEQLYKVVDSSDVLCIVLDARDPDGTRPKILENYLAKNVPHKHLVYILNKIDLVPIWVTAKWVKHLNKSRPTIAFKSSTTNPFGKGSLINLLRQYDQFHKDKKEISIGFVGYPNVGKSSVINALKEKDCCKAAPIPGQTKVWQYITLTSRINLIDCPGTVHWAEGKSDIDQVLKGCVRAQRVKDPMFYIPEILSKAKSSQLKGLYKIDDWKDEQQFIKKVGRSRGKLLKGGQVDQIATSKIVLMDWCRGRIMYYNLPEGVPTNQQFYKQEQPQDAQSQEINEEALGRLQMQLQEQ